MNTVPYRDEGTGHTPDGPPVPDTVAPVPAARPGAADLPAPPGGPGDLGRLGPYRLLRLLGAGGMGVVYLAEDTLLRRAVALKTMRPELAALPSCRRRFLREARAVAAIRHDHVVTVYQVGEDRGVPFLVMELLEGEPLKDRLERGGVGAPLPTPEALRIGREVAEGLAAAHERGLVHRDVKPSNVWLEGGRDRVKILDFGLARMGGAGEAVTEPGLVMGTPGYLAPEQARGEAVDHRCDLFALGCLLYRLGTGRPAFRGNDPASLLAAVLTQQPVPPGRYNPELPPALAELILRLLARDPAARPPSARAVAEALAALETEKDLEGGATRATRGHGRFRLRVAAVLAILLAGALVAVPALVRRGPGGGSGEGAGGAAAPAGLPEGKAGAPGTVDLLARINPAEDAVEGKWRKEGPVLATTPVRGARFQRLRVPYHPPGEYDLRLVAERVANDGNGLHLGLVVGPRQAMLVLDGFPSVVSGLDQLDGNWASDNASTYRGPQIFPVGERVTVAVQVRKGGVRVERGGQKVIDWKGDPRRLSLPDFFRIPDRLSLSLAAEASFRVHSLTLTPASPAGR